MDLMQAVAYLLRVTHLVTAMLLIGGLFHAWNLSRAGGTQTPVADGFRPVFPVLVLLLLLAGSGTFALKMQQTLPKMYHMLFGVKFLLFLHVAAVGTILVKPATTAEKRAKLWPGVAISSILILLLATGLRFLSN
jgi:hypothetical protein